MSQKMDSPLPYFSVLLRTPFRFEAYECSCGMAEILSISAVPFPMCSGFPLRMGSCVINMCENLFPTRSTKCRSSQSKSLCSQSFSTASCIL